MSLLLMVLLVLCAYAAMTDVVCAVSRMMAGSIGRASGTAAAAASAAAYHVM